MAEFSDDEKRLLRETIAEIGRTVPSHKAALEKLAASDAAEHAKVTELAAMVNEHTRLLEAYRKASTENFENLSRLVNEQSKAITAIRDVLFPPTPPTKPGTA